MKTPEEQSQVEFLASVDLLSTMTRVEIERLAQGAQSQLLAFGDTLCAAGNPADGLYIVRSVLDKCGGEVKVEDRVPGDYSRGVKFTVMIPAAEGADGKS